MPTYIRTCAHTINKQVSREKKENPKSRHGWDPAVQPVMAASQPTCLLSQPSFFHDNVTSCTFNWYRGSHLPTV